MARHDQIDVDQRAQHLGHFLDHRASERRGAEVELSSPVGLSSLLGKSESFVNDIIESRAVRRAVVGKRELIERYGTKDIGRTEQELGRRTAIAFRDSGAVAIRVWDTDPAEASALAEAYLEVIRDRAERFVQVKTEHLRQFLEARAKATDDELRAALKAWQHFQENSSVLEVRGSAQALRGMMVQLATKRAEAMAELKSLEASLSDAAPLVNSRRTYIRELDRHINSLRGESRNDSHGGLIGSSGRDPLSLDTT